MPTSPILDVVIGLVFFFTALSLLSSSIQERISAALDMRSRGLERWIVNTLGSDAAKRFYAHPVIAGLGGTKASYISSQAFTTALFESCNVISNPSVAAVGIGADPLKQADAADGIRKILADLPAGAAAEALRAHFEHAQGDVVQARADIERWFDGAMDRVSGAYKRQIHRYLIGITVVLTIVINADAIRVARVVYRDPVVRAALTEEARTASAKAIDPQAIANGLPLPLGWTNDAPPPIGTSPFWYLQKLLGMVLTVVGVSLGAPFWFDLLNRVVNLRAAGAKPPSTTTST